MHSGGQIFMRCGCFLALSTALGGAAIAQNSDAELRYDPGLIAKEIVANGTEVIWDLARDGAPERAVFALFGVRGAFSQRELSEDFPHVRHEALRAIASIDGHAKIIADRIHAKSGQVGTGRSRSGHFGMLRNLGTPEAVDAIASFLDDNFIHPGDAERYLSVLLASNSILAAETLAAMQFPDSPTERWINGSPKEIALWKEWREKRAQERAKGSDPISPRTNGADHGAVDLVSESGSSDQRGSLDWIIWLVVIGVLVLGGRVVWRRAQS